MARPVLGTALLAILAAPPAHAQDEPRVVQEIRRALEEIPQYGVFDWITFAHDRGQVTLDGFARDPSLRGAAEAAVRRVEGVEQVINRIETLPNLASDEKLRQEIHRAIYRDSPLLRYERADGTAAIHIVVNRGDVTLAGTVERTDDKRLAQLKARSVFGVRKVENALAVTGQAR
ncbi:MAG TPA: BON domain-containing protein [Vicinamibacteria bacterium]|nr:BON domain-containing protein [Vicinamibacteria bacterium]